MVSIFDIYLRGLYHDKVKKLYSQGRAKKAKKFAMTKRLISLKDSRM